VRIAVVTETFHPFKGGSAKRYLETFKRIVKRGHEVDLYTARLKADWPRHEEVAGINVHRSDDALTDFITKDGFRSIRQVTKFTGWAFHRLFREKYDILEANHCPVFPALGSSIYSKLKSTPLSITFHEAWYSDWYNYVPVRVYAPIGIMLERMTTWLPDVAVAVSDLTAQRLVAHFNIPREKVRVVSNGVDLDLFSRINCRRDRFKIIYLGRLNPHKRLDWLLEAYRSVKREYPEVSLEIVGDGPSRASSEEYVRRRGMEDIVFQGSITDEELVRCIKSAGVYVLPSVREGQSITTLEAMAAGTPQIVVAVNANGACDLIRSSGSGIAVEPSPSSIVNGIRSILDDEGQWRSLHERGLEFVKGYSWDRVAEEYLKIYELALADVSGRG
jgi:glycosyltransferase involved in cell wall biosynthesis